MAVPLPTSFTPTTTTMHEIVLATRGLNLIKESDYKLLLDNHLGMQTLDCGFAHHGLLKSATWFVEKWVSEGWHLFFFVFFLFRLLLVKFSLCSCSVLGLSFLVDEVDYVDVALPFYMIVQ